MANVGWWANPEPLFLGHGRRLGEPRSRERRLTLTPQQRTRHIYGIGGSGGGKSRFQRNLLARDNINGVGYALLDCQDLVRENLWTIANIALPGRLTTEKIAQLGHKVIVIDPANPRYGSAGFNFLAPRPGLETFELVDALVQLLTELFPQSMGPRLIDITRMSLLCLAEHGLTIAEMPLFLSDETVRTALVQRCRNPEVQTFFLQHLGGLRPAEMKAWMESSRNKWNAFITPFLLPFVGQTVSTIDFRDIINSGKILLINLSRSHLALESRSLAGGMLLNALHQAFLSREDAPPAQRYLYALYVDEAQTYYTSTYNEILEAGRKYGISLNLFHQSTRQAPFDTNRGAIDGIIANSHTRVCFGVARQDAERMAAEFFTPTGVNIKYQGELLGIPYERPQYYSLGEEMQANVAELMHQQTRECFISFKGFEDDPRPYMVRTPFVPDVFPCPEKVDALMQHIARRYYRPIDQINRSIQERWTRLRALAAGDIATPQPRDFTR